MSKTQPQEMPIIMNFTSGCFPANGASTKTFISAEPGFSKIVGFMTTDVALESASGLIIKQSIDGGANYDLVSASDTLGAGASVTCLTEVYGNSFEITIKNGATEASALRCLFMLRPI